MSSAQQVTKQKQQKPQKPQKPGTPVLKKREPEQQPQMKLSEGMDVLVQLEGEKIEAKVVRPSSDGKKVKVKFGQRQPWVSIGDVAVVEPASDSDQPEPDPMERLPGYVVDRGPEPDIEAPETGR